jgi:hypothetical protein
MASPPHASRNAILGLGLVALGAVLLFARVAGGSNAPAATTANGDTWPPVPVKMATRT